MAGALEYLWGTQAPSAVNTSTGMTSGLPEWYQEYIRGIAGKGTQIAGAQSTADVPALSVAGFNQDQIDSFSGVRENQGAWKPDLEAARSAASGIVPAANGLIQQGQSAVSGPAQTWDDAAAAKYMSPYTKQVTENIQRLGLRNLNENLLPAVQDQFIGAGQFGSTRNADIIGRTVRDANADISGQVGNALNQGYTNAQTAFNMDANREQQQQQMQSGAALQGAGLTTSTGSTAAGALSSLGTATAALGLTDAQQLGAIGGQQQGLQQEGLNAGYTNANNAMNFDWDTLNKLGSVVRGTQLPQSAVQTTNGALPGAGFTAGPLAQVGGALNSLSTTTKKV